MTGKIFTVHESRDDLDRLQALLDESHAAGGDHLRSIFSDRHRLGAAELAETLTGVRVLALATSTAAGAPLVAPVDGLFYRGDFWFGSSPESARFRHIRARPEVSGCHTVGEDLAVVVHGRAERVGLESPAGAGYRAYLTEVYGKGWAEWGAGAAYARIEPRRLYAIRFRHGQTG